jgi:hypothetical protein
VARSQDEFVNGYSQSERQRSSKGVGGHECTSRAKTAVGLIKIPFPSNVSLEEDISVLSRVLEGQKLERLEWDEATANE